MEFFIWFEYQFKIKPTNEECAVSASNGWTDLDEIWNSQLLTWNTGYLLSRRPNPYYT